MYCYSADCLKELNIQLKPVSKSASKRQKLTLLQATFEAKLDSILDPSQLRVPGNIAKRLSSISLDHHHNVGQFAIRIKQVARDLVLDPEFRLLHGLKEQDYELHPVDTIAPLYLVALPNLIEMNRQRYAQLAFVTRQGRVVLVKSFPVNTHLAALEPQDTFISYLFSCLVQKNSPIVCQVATRVDCMDLYLTVDVFWNKAVRQCQDESLFKCLYALSASTEFSMDYKDNQSAKLVRFNDAYLPEIYDPILQIQPELLLPRLLPYQKRALSWMLEREGYNEVRYWEPLMKESILCDYWKGSRLYFDFDQNTVSLDPFPPCADIRGGILAEEMGLGKTVEILALIVQHACPTDIYKQLKYQERSCECGQFDTSLAMVCAKCRRPICGQCKYCPECNASSDHYIMSKSTLIITPLAILDQWKTELTHHAPSLKWTVYEGAKKSNSLQAQDFANLYDVVLTTYDVLGKELVYVAPSSDRPRRYERKYIPPKSLLTQICWWRCCLDEVQMIESLTTHPAKMASCLARIHAWGISGTPMSKRGAADLIGLAVFLRLPLEPMFQLYLDEPMMWIPLYRTLHRFMHRNLKKYLTSELTLPPQTEETYYLQFSRVEEHRYACLVEEYKEELQANEKKRPRRLNEDDNWSTEDKRKLKAFEEKKEAIMRKWMLRLRQTCCHPQVGTSNRDELGKEFKSMLDLVETMFWHSRSQTLSLERVLFVFYMEMAQMHEFDQNHKKAIELYELHLVGIQGQIRQIEEQVAQVKDKITECKSRLSQTSPESLSNDEEDKLEEWRSIEKTLTAHIMSWKELLHQYVFFIACCYHVLENQEKEDEHYNWASSIRSDLLKSHTIQNKAVCDKMVQEINAVNKDLFDSNPISTSRKIHAFNKSRGGQGMYIGTYENYHGGIKSGPLFEKVTMVVDLLNDQWEQLDALRDELIQVLLSQVEENDAENATGEEYEKGLEMQEMGTILQNVYMHVLGQRMRLLSGVTLPNMVLILPNRKERELLDKFPTLPSDSHVSLRKLVNELKQVAQSFHVRSEEISMCEMASRMLQKDLDRQLNKFQVLEKEREAFSKLYNSRIEYFRYLQKISDSVQEHEPVRDTESHRKTIQMKMDQLALKIARSQGRVRYLKTLFEEETRKSQGNNSLESENPERECGICQCNFKSGLLLPCAHVFCEECIKAWVAIHRQCPLCKESVTLNLLKPVSFDKPQVQPFSPAPQQQQLDTRHAQFFKHLHQRIPLMGSFGIKMDTILRHIQYLRQTDSSIKVLVFSQWKQVLDILARGLTMNDIHYTDLDKSKLNAAMTFINDPNCVVFMLNAKSQSQGLTLIAATHVFILEPFLNVGLELQAINRVHRIGQTKPTFVHRYIIKNTIEHIIYEKNAQRLSNDASVRHDELSRKLAKGQAGEDIKQEDLLHILSLV